MDEDKVMRNLREHSSGDSYHILHLLPHQRQNRHIPQHDHLSRRRQNQHSL